MKILCCLAIVFLTTGHHIGRADESSAEKPPAGFAKTADEKLAILKAFRSEFITITPGKGKFPGQFAMGSETCGPATLPVRQVKMVGEFAIAKYEVPQNLYQAVMDTNPSVWGGPRNSVEMVSWADAVRFCTRATQQLQGAGLITADEFIRLPGEAEWEYCCRAGSKTEYSFGPTATAKTDKDKQASLLNAYGWHTGNAAGNDPPVGALKPNAWGLYDMHGYLWEYTADGWHADYQNAPATSRVWQSPAAGALRVMRSGSWRDRHEFLKSSVRWPIPDHAKSDAIGFRCVLARKPQS